MSNVGRVGRHVSVETPFTCDYGYNITIGHHVVIGRNCTINDAGEVKIGDNCVLGPNVSIFTTSLPIDPKIRQGGQGPQVGCAITIEQDCWIGGGAIILPGRSVGRGSTVGAGSVVTRVCLPFSFFWGLFFCSLFSRPLLFLSSLFRLHFFLAELEFSLS